MSNPNLFVSSPANRAQSRQYRVFAFLVWAIAMIGQVFTIVLSSRDNTLVWFVLATAVILMFTIAASVLWKKANRLDPSSEINKIKFYLRSQFGFVMGVLAFIPLVVFIFMNENIDVKTNGIAGVFPIIALIAAGISGVDLNTPSKEKYTQEINNQTTTLKKLNFDIDNAYFSKSERYYHIFENCQYVNGRQNMSNGTVRHSWELRGISSLCQLCEKKAT